MYQTKTYDNCKLYGYEACSHKNDEIMKRATQEIPEYHGGEIETMLSQPLDEEINAICKECDEFTQK